MIKQLEQALDALSMRQQTVANNLANVDTPHFTRSDVDFFTYMKGVMADNPTPLAAQPDTQTAARLDGNNVTLEQELFALTQTDMLYNSASRFTSDELKQLSYAATDGRG
jgi:flagellar basal-body rod protein FlgB